MTSFLLNALLYGAVLVVFTLAERYWWAKVLVLLGVAWALQSVLRGFLADCIAGNPVGASLVLIVLVIIAQWWKAVGEALYRPAITARLTKRKAPPGKTPGS